MGKLISLEDVAYIKLVNSLPKEYNITIYRQVDPLTSASKDWEEKIMWDIDDDNLDNEIGDALIFNHVLTMLHHFICEPGDFREQFKLYIQDELLSEIENDRNFNS